MSERICGQLDDYLSGWLNEPDTAAFEAHLRQCPECRRECERQRRLDVLLAQARSQLELVPPALVRRLEQRCVTIRHWRMVGAGVGLGAAAALLMCVLFWPHRSSTDRAGTIVSGGADTAPATTVGPSSDQGADQVPMKQLALLVTSHCASACPSPHPVIRATRIPAPTGPVLPSVRVARREKPDEKTESKDDSRNGPKTVVMPSVPNGANIQACLTLGARGLAGIVWP